MLPERAEMMLAQYRRCVGRCAFLKKTIAEAEADIELWRRNLAEDLVLSGGANLDGMPRGTTVGNPTERMAIMLATGYEPEDLKDAEASLIPLRDELREAGHRHERRLRLPVDQGGRGRLREALAAPVRVHGRA